jgi:uncharacterized protein
MHFLHGLKRKITVAILAAGCALVLQRATAGEIPDGNHSGPAIWRIRSAESTVYLFGSIHILPVEFAWRSKRIEDAMAASDLFVFEVPTGKESLAEEHDFVLRNGILPRRQSIKAMLSPGEFDTYSSVMRNAGLIPGDYERYRPWLAALVLGLAYLHPDNLTTLRGADDEIMDYARGHERQTNYLETPLQQLQLLTAGTERVQLAGLRRLINALPGSRNLEENLRGAWARGDADGLNALLDRVFSSSPETQDFLVGRRNRLWLPTINAALQRPGSAMITVGAAHIGGKSGLVTLICSEGYRVERLSDSGGEADVCSPAAEQAQMAGRP